LNDLFYRKCAYCESSIETVGVGTVEHFRPKLNAAGLRKQVRPDHYWWLAYDWENLYLSCLVCNRHKRNVFPVRRRRAEPEARGVKLDAEKRLLLDPCADDPEGVLSYNSKGYIRGQDEQAQVTIEVLGLNRPALVRARRERIAQIRPLLADWTAALRQAKRGKKTSKETMDQTGDFKERLSSYADPSQPYAGLARWLIRKTQEATGGLRKKPSRPKPARRHRLTKREKTHRRKLIADLGSVWIESIDLRNFMGIHDLTVSFPPILSGHDPWLVLVGTNGVGKSSILKAIALTLISDVQRKRLAPAAWTWMNHGTEDHSGYVRLNLNDGRSVELSFTKRGRDFKVRGQAPQLQLLGYGSTRLPPPPGRRSRPRPQRVCVDNLFDPRRPLSDVESWIADTSYFPARRLNMLKPALKRLLSLEEDDDISRYNGKLYIHQHGDRCSLREWSDGYQSIITLATDIMLHFSRAGRHMELVEGTVLLDEIEAHLHPSWKMQIVSTLRQVFPRVRFIVTTHDPLCLHSLKKGEVCLLDRDPETSRVQVEPLDVVEGMRADQVLTGAWFGLNSTLDEKTLGLMEKHGRLLLKPKTQENRVRREKLEEKLRERMGTFAETSIERIALSVAAELMSKKSRKLPTERRQELRKKIMDQVQKRLEERKNYGPV
jgi:uncharacterized protein (TIGR02646 family)